jgi:mannose-binding lectin
MIVYAQTSGSHNTNSGSWTPIPGLAIKLPRAVGDVGLVILNVPNPYAQGNNYPGGNFGLRVNGTILGPFAAFTYNEQQPQGTGRVPTTLTVVTQLSQTADTSVEAMWSGIRGSNVVIDSPAMLTAIVEAAG